MEPYAFVTVGTTAFPRLVAQATSREFTTCLKEVWGIRHVVIQYGRGEVPAGCDGDGSFEVDGVTISCFPLKPDIGKDMEAASLIVTHAGAGSICESCRILRNDKRVPVIAVVNDALAGNHQQELATAMSSRHYLLHCHPETLPEMVSRKEELRNLKVLPQPSLGAFSAALDEMFGFLPDA